MLIRETDIGFMLRLVKEEPYMESMINFVKEKGIGSGIISAIGAVKDTRIGYYDLAQKKYFDRTFEEEAELVSLTGNVSWFEGEPVCHTHCAISNTDYHTFAGHLFELTAAVTVEIWLQPSSTRIERKPDCEIGLNLLDL